VTVFSKTEISAAVIREGFDFHQKKSRASREKTEKIRQLDPPFSSQPSEKKGAL
jgi:hypothetical protein